jgi:hypothetical protein
MPVVLVQGADLEWASPFICFIVENAARVPNFFFVRKKSHGELLSG